MGYIISTVVFCAESKSGLCFLPARQVFGLQSGYTKHCCFLCTWDSRARDRHYNVKVWSHRKTLEPGKINVAQNPLVDPKKTLLPPIHVKLGIVKNLFYLF